MKHRIIENFLPEETFKKIADHIYTPSFGWGYNECVAFEEPSKDDNFYFTHELYNWGAPKCTFFTSSPAKIAGIIPTLEKIE